MLEIKMLSRPINIGELEIKNRFIVPAMGIGMANADGTVSEREIAYYAARAKGGFGLIITEFTAVKADGKGGPRQSGLWDDNHIPGWAKLAKAVHAHGARLAPQLHYAGNKAHTAIPGNRPVGPSPFSYVPPRGRLIDLNPPVAQEMTAEDIENIVNAYGEAARRAREAGCDAVELHGAHGYFLAQFMSPAENKRIDSWGGGVESRMKLAVDVVRKIKEKAGADFPVIYKMSINEMQPGGLTLEETQLIAWLLERAGVDCLDLSRGSLNFSVHWSTPPLDVPPAAWVTRETWLIKQVVHVPVVAIGRIYDPVMGEFILQTGKADLIAFGRASLADPELPNKTKSGKLDEIRPCIGCSACGDTRRRDDVFVTCTMNPELGKESEMLPLVPAKKAKKVLVVGGGPGGLEAARVAALRGHDVTLYEKENRLGGQLWVGALPPAKQQFLNGLKWLWAQAQKAGVKIELGIEVTPELILKAKPDAVIIATGGTYYIPQGIPGIAKPQVVTASDILLEKVHCGKRVVVLGANLIGCEVADWLGWHRKEVILVKMRPGSDVAEDMVYHRRPFLLDRLAEWKVRTVNGTKDGVKIKEITDESVVIIRDGQEETLPADSVVLALGIAPVNGLAELLKGKVAEIYVIGDAKKPRQATEAVREGSVTAREI